MKIPFYKKKILTWITIGTVITSALVILGVMVWIKKPFEPKLSPSVQQQIEGWIADFDSSDPNVLLSAHKNLFNADKEAVDLMLVALTDEKQGLRVKLWIVGVFYDMAYKHKGGLDDEIKRQKVVESVIPFLWAKSNDLPLLAYEFRVSSYIALDMIGGPQAEEAIRKAKADDNWVFRPGLEYLKSSNSPERAVGAMLLSVTDSRAEGPLLSALEKETNFAPKFRQIEALGKVGTSRSIPALEKIATRDENKLLRNIAEVALKKIIERQGVK